MVESIFTEKRTFWPNNMAKRKPKSKKSSQSSPSDGRSKSVRQLWGTGGGSGQSMSRMASLAVLLAIIVLILVMFYRVMSGFVLPLFLAALCAVIFRPIHHWMLTKLGDRESLAAGLTTAAILGIVLLPLSGTLMLAGTQAYRKYQLEKDNSSYLNKLADFGTKLGFARPFRNTLSDLDDQITALPDKLPDADEFENSRILENIESTRETLVNLRKEIHIALDETKLADDANQTTPEAKSVARMVKSKFIIEHSDENQPEDDEGQFDFDSLDHLEQILFHSAALVGGESASSIEQAQKAEIEKAEDAADADAESKDEAQNKDQKPKKKVRIILPREDFPKIKTIHQNLIDQLHGGALWRHATDVFFPSKRNLNDTKEYVDRQLNKWLPSVTGQATAFITQILVGIAIMTLGLFYFLKDGPGMIRAIMRLSPLDDRYELELLSEFDSVSRAVVLATLLSALAQGVLAGIGYYFAFSSLSTVFLLTMMTTVMAMVPVVGAGAIWMPACVWLAVVDNRLFAAAVLAIYGATIVSMIDNLIKPIILHGQSNLHPLLALLSVLGGVSALGPIGIIVGPMVVAFLQALLNMLHLEIQAFDSTDTEESATAQ